MGDIKGNILIISSKDPEYSASLGLDIMRSLESEGYNVDYLTKYEYNGNIDNVFSIEKKSKVREFRRIISKVLGKNVVEYVIDKLKKVGIVK